VFQYAWKLVFENIWMLWNQLGPVEQVSMMMKDKMIRLSRTELQGKYNLAPNGRIGGDDPESEAMKAKQRLAEHLGDIYYDQYELRYDALLKDDPRLVRRLLRPKETVGELMQMQQLIQQQQEQIKALQSGKQSEKNVQSKEAEQKKPGRPGEKAPAPATIKDRSLLMNETGGMNG
jgi:hypothetical protein